MCFFIILTYTFLLYQNWIATKMGKIGIEKKQEVSEAYGFKISTLQQHIKMHKYKIFYHKAIHF